jgi:hypothetical protein
MKKILLLVVITFLCFFSFLGGLVFLLKLTPHPGNPLFLLVTGGNLLNKQTWLTSGLGFYIIVYNCSKLVLLMVMMLCVLCCGRVKGWSGLRPALLEVIG